MTRWRSKRSEFGWLRFVLLSIIKHIRIMALARYNIPFINNINTGQWFPNTRVLFKVAAFLKLAVLFWQANIFLRFIIIETRSLNDSVKTIIM